MAFSICPECNQKIDIGEDQDIGLRLVCDSCLAELVVVWLNPIELMSIDYEDFPEFGGDFYNENFQKIRKRRGGNHGVRKSQERYEEDY